MASMLLHPPPHLAPSVALQLSQQAPIILQNPPNSTSLPSVNSLYASAETADLWTTYDNLMQSCLRTGDEQSAHVCLERLTSRFGPENERVMASKGLLQEAIAEDDVALQKVLEEYDSILERDQTNMPISKRRIALLKYLGKQPEAIIALNNLLEASPTDAEAWAELAELYISQGLYQQGIFALEEVLLITPNAWNIHARLGEVQYITAAAVGSGSSSESSMGVHLTESLRRFCRSIELCDDYLRGYYGLKLASDRLLPLLPQLGRQSKSEEVSSLPEVKTVQLLNQTATAKLSEIVRRSAGGEKGWQGYDSAELIAARELLNRDTSPVVR